MKPTIMLHPIHRTFTDKALLRFRMWRRSFRYERNCPSALPTHQRLRLHFTYLQLYWSRVVEFQAAVGLEAAYFCPEEQFELIFVVTRRVEKDLGNTVLPFGETMDKWREYSALLGTLSYDLNPYEFSERCSRCLRFLEFINRPRAAAADPIKMDTSHFFRMASQDAPADWRMAQPVSSGR